MAHQHDPALVYNNVNNNILYIHVIMFKFCSWLDWNEGSFSFTLDVDIVRLLSDYHSYNNKHSGNKIKCNNDTYRHRSIYGLVILQHLIVGDS